MFVFGAIVGGVVGLVVGGFGGYVFQGWINKGLRKGKKSI